MKKYVILILLFFPIFLYSGELKDVFQNPPDKAKPRGYWVWPHGNFDYATIEKELREFRDKGLSGVDIFDLGVKDPNDVIPAGPAFMSPEQVDGMAYALQVAKELGLKVGLIVSSSWNAGGSWTTPEYAAMNLVASMDTVTGPLTLDRELPFPALPDSFSKPYGKFPLHVPRDDNGEPLYKNDVVTIAFPLDREGKLDDPKQVRVFRDPHVKTDLPAGQWVIMRTVCANFGQMLWIPSDNSKGLCIDHFNPDAVRDHFMTVIDRLEARCGPLQNTALDRLYLASYESNADIIWTPGLEEDFARMHGYRLEPYLPALFGIEVVDAETTRRFLYDFRETVSELFVNNLYRNARDICHEHGLKLCCEAGGPGAPLHDVPTEDLKALGSLDVMRGEFWVDQQHRLNPDGFEQLQIVKSIASAAHIYGKKIVEMESFTSHKSWNIGPYILKPLADRAFCEGMTRVVYHTMTHNLPEAGLPGWTYGAGTHISTNTIWWNMSGPLHAYLARCSAMLQQGNFVADACFYYGHELPNFGKPKHVYPTLGPGYDYDEINTEVLLTAKVVDGRIVLPGGMSYALLVLPDDESMDLLMLQKIKSLLNDGATIMGPKPKRVYGLDDYREQERELNRLADEMWGRGDVKKCDVRIGKGRLVSGKTARSLLKDMGLGPDVEFIPAGVTNVNCDYIHRRTDNEDIYFIRNVDSTTVRLDVDMRVSGKQPQLWDAVTGEMKHPAIYARDASRTRMPLVLGPFESVFVVFTDGPDQPHITRVQYDGRTCFPLVKKSSPVALEAALKGDQILISTEQAGEYRFELNTGAKYEMIISPRSLFTIVGSWDVRFTAGWEAKPVQTFEKLISWTECDDPGTRAYSGTATYHKTFVVDDQVFAKPQRIWLDLGEVGEAASVYLNGVDLGSSVFVPHRYDVTDVLHSGENYLVVSVANTWLNRLIEDDKRPEKDRLTHTNLKYGPEGGHKWSDSKPKASGLLGPVRIVCPASKRVKLDEFK